jgi:hypothetical protein
MQGVFISYRQSDSKAWAVLLREELGDLFGHERFFLDRDTLAAGSWREQIAQSLDRCRVVLVLIGPGWLDARNADQTRRLDDPDDVHRNEVADALSRAGTTVIPVLIDGTPMPPRSALPPDLFELAERQARTLSSVKVHRDVDLRSLADDIRTATGMPFTPGVATAAEPMHFMAAQLDESRARSAFAAWTGQRLMAPRDFQAQARLGPLVGTWQPCWVAEAQIAVLWRGRRGEKRQVEQDGVDDKGQPARRSVERTEWTDVQGDLRATLDAIVLDALPPAHDDAPPLLTAALRDVQRAPVLPDATRTVRPATVERDAALAAAAGRIDTLTRDLVRKKIGGHAQEVTQVDVRQETCTLRLVWVPVYEGRYTYGAEDHPVMVNAHSGEVGGPSPMSKAKLGLAIGLGVAVVALIVLLFFVFGR